MNIEDKYLNEKSNNINDLAIETLDRIKKIIFSPYEQSQSSVCGKIGAILLEYEHKTKKSGGYNEHRR